MESSIERVIITIINDVSYTNAIVLDKNKSIKLRTKE